MHPPSALLHGGVRARLTARGAVAFGLLVLLCACASSPSRRALPAGKTAIPIAQADAQDELLQLLAGQFALLDGEPRTAADHFLRAAELSDDPAVSETAVQLAIGARDWGLARRALIRWRALSPGQPGLLAAQAAIALGENRGEEAFDQLHQLAARADVEAWRGIARVLLGVADRQAAAALLRRLDGPVQLGGEESNWIAVSQLAFRLEDRVEARRLANAAVARFHSAEGYRWAARLAFDLEDRAAARELYAEGVRRHPADSRLRAAYADLLADAGDRAAAARVLAKGKQDDRTFAARAAYAAHDDDRKALAIVYREAQADGPPYSQARIYLLAQLAEMQEQRARALEWYAQIGEDDERWFDAQTRRAVLLDGMGRIDQALRLLHQVEQAAVGDRERLLRAYLIEANVLARRGRLDEARAVYVRGMEAAPGDSDLLYSRALMEIEHGQVTAGERDLRQIIAVEPDNPEALNALGYTLADHARKGDPALDEARVLLDRALTLKPDEPAILDSMGWLHFRTGELDQALTLLRRAWAGQTDAEIAAHLGEALWVKGEHAEARRIWDAGRRKEADNRVLLDTIRRLDS